MLQLLRLTKVNAMHTYARALRLVNRSATRKRIIRKP